MAADSCRVGVREHFIRVWHTTRSLTRVNIFVKLILGGPTRFREHRFMGSKMYFSGLRKFVAAEIFCVKFLVLAKFRWCGFFRSKMYFLGLRKFVAIGRFPLHGAVDLIPPAVRQGGLGASEISCVSRMVGVTADFRGFLTFELEETSDQTR